MEIRVSAHDLEEVFFDPCPNVYGEKNIDNPEAHGPWNSCELCDHGQVLSEFGKKVAEAFARLKK